MKNESAREQEYFRKRDEIASRIDDIQFEWFIDRENSTRMKDKALADYDMLRREYADLDYVRELDQCFAALA